MVLSDIAVAVLLYVLLAPAGRSLSMAAAGFRLTQAAVLAANLLHHHTAPLLVSGAPYAAGPAPLRNLTAPSTP